MLYSDDDAECISLVHMAHLLPGSRRHALKTARLSEQLVHSEEMGLADGASLLSCPRRTAWIRKATEAEYEAYMLNAPGPTNLHVLIRLNLLHALARNAVLMGFWPEGLCKDDFVPPYNEYGPQLPHKRLPLSACPETLAPTPLQRTVLHHPWIDLFPFPGFRDRALQAIDAGALDEDELCLNILEVEECDLEDRCDLIV